MGILSLDRLCKVDRDAKFRISSDPWPISFKKKNAGRVFLYQELDTVVEMFVFAERGLISNINTRSGPFAPLSDYRFKKQRQHSYQKRCDMKHMHYYSLQKKIRRPSVQCKCSTRRRVCERDFAALEHNYVQTPIRHTAVSPNVLSLAALAGSCRHSNAVEAV